MTENRSIHPRNWPGGNGVVVNTRKAPNPGKYDRIHAAVAEHCERNPNDKVAATRRDKLATLAAKAGA